MGVVRKRTVFIRANGRVMSAWTIARMYTSIGAKDVLFIVQCVYVFVCANACMHVYGDGGVEGGGCITCQEQSLEYIWCDGTPIDTIDHRQWSALRRSWKQGVTKRLGQKFKWVRRRQRKTSGYRIARDTRIIKKKGTPLEISVIIMHVPCSMRSP